MVQETRKIHGSRNTVVGVNPNLTHFIVRYPDGSSFKGGGLQDPKWIQVKNGLSELSYVLSTGQVIKLPKFKAYWPLVECSVSIEGSKMYHSVIIKCLEDNSVVLWKIVLIEHPRSKYKIGDIILSREPLPREKSKYWRYTS